MLGVIFPSLAIFKRLDLFGKFLPFSQLFTVPLLVSKRLPNSSIDSPRESLISLILKPTCFLFVSINIYLNVIIVVFTPKVNKSIDIIKR